MLTGPAPIPEEILSSNVAMWFSRRGDRMVFATFNDSSVTATPVTYYHPSGSDAKYPAVYWIRYPQVCAYPAVTLYPTLPTVYWIRYPQVGAYPAVLIPLHPHPTVYWIRYLQVGAHGSPVKEW